MEKNLKSSRCFLAFCCVLIAAITVVICNSDAPQAVKGIALAASGLTVFASVMSEIVINRIKKIMEPSKAAEKEQKHRFLLYITDGDVTVSLWFLSRTRNEDENLDAVKRAIAEYLNTPEGQAALENNHGVFNWGDVYAYVPERFFNDQGLSLCENSCATESYTVNADENLAR